MCCSGLSGTQELRNRPTSLRLGFTLHTWALIHIIYIFSFEMNFNKTGLPSSNTSYKIGHICETLARTLRTIPQFLSSFWINNPEQHKPERLFLSSYASEQKRWRELCGRFLSSPVPFGSTIPGGTGELGNWGTEARSTTGTELLRRSAENRRTPRTYTHIKRAIHHDEGSVQG